jgi:hypothetical protein
MGFIISSSKNEKTFKDKNLISIGSKPEFDYQIDIGIDFMLTVQYSNNKCVVLNQFNNPIFLFKGEGFEKLEVDNIAKIKIDGTDEFITIKVVPEVVENKNLETVEIKNLYGNNAKLKLDELQANIDKNRVSILKQVSYTINDYKKKLSMNSKTGILLHIGMLLASFITAFGVSNYLTGLPLKDSVNVIQMPTNLKLIFMYTLIVYSLGLMLKQGVFLNLQKKSGIKSVSAEVDTILLIVSTIFFAAIYIINVLYYISPGIFPVFAILISLFFTTTTAFLAIGCGYFKNNSVVYSMELDKVEYREDFEKVVKDYQKWIELYVNNLSQNKIKNIKDKLFSLQIKSVAETILGVLTAPFLAYGVSNTLAMCFPEAAGWIRISGLRFSPVFLVLATFLIIFAFFMFVNSFLSNRKILASNVLKQDGFSNYLQHGVEIFGVEGVRRLNSDLRRSFVIGLSIICIEFSMNVSYFSQEIGGDLSGLMLSLVAALVPTALLIAETYMLSQTKFEIYACDELISKLD